MNSNRILAVVVTTITDEFLSCFQASTLTGVMGGIWAGGRGYHYVKVCFLIEGFRSRPYTICTDRYPEGDSIMTKLLRDAVDEGWRPFNRALREKVVSAPQFGLKG